MDLIVDQLSYACYIATTRQKTLVRVRRKLKFYRTGKKKQKDVLLQIEVFLLVFPQCTRCF